MKNSQHERKNKEMGQIALKGVSADIKIIGSLCHTTLSQNFLNQESQPIEAVYSFPLPMNACVSGFSLIKNGQETIGAIKSRDEALESYEQALSDGDSAYLLDEDRPNIFSISAGNLMPGENIIIKIKYSQMLEKNDDVYRFILPTTIAPLYTPAKFLQQMDPAERDRIYPPISTEPLPYGLNLKAEIVMPGGIKSVESPSHTIKTSMNEKGIQLEFSADTVKMDRDFVLKIEEAEHSENYALLMKDPFADGYIAMMELCSEKEIERPAKNLVFIVDCSGSMYGESIEQAKNALMIMLSSLCEGDRFNMIAFGNEYKLFSDRMEKYEDGVLHLARKWVESLDADMGGTEILGPIKAVYELPLDEKGCDVILLTDGAVGNHSEIINFVKNGDIDINRIPARQILFGYVHEKIIPKKRPHKILRFFTLGVGYGADENLLRSLAEINGGAMKNIHPSEKIEPAVLSLFKKTFVESIKEAKVQWNDQFSENISQLKSGLSKGQNFVHFCHLKEIPTDEVKLLLTYSDDTTDTYTAHIKTIEEDIESGLAQLYAKYTIEEKGRLLRPAQKIKLGKMALLAEQYGILSKYTSFVLTDPVLDKKYTSYEYRRIPSQMLYGMEPQFCAVYPGDFFKCMEFNSLSKTMNPLTSHNQHHPISFMKSDMVKDNNFSYTEDEENTHQKRKNQNNVLLHVITLQKASGYWENSPELQDLKFLDKELIHKITEMLIQECHVSKKIAGNVAISLFMLNLFEHRFASKKNEWEHVGKKCKNWLKKNGINEDIIQDVYQMI